MNWLSREDSERTLLLLWDILSNFKTILKLVMGLLKDFRSTITRQPFISPAPLCRCFPIRRPTLWTRRTPMASSKRWKRLICRVMWLLLTKLMKTKKLHFQAINRITVGQNNLKLNQKKLLKMTSLNLTKKIVGVSPTKQKKNSKGRNNLSPQNLRILKICFLTKMTSSLSRPTNNPKTPYRRINLASKLSPSKNTYSTPS